MFSEAGKTPYALPDQPGASVGALAELYNTHKHGNDTAVDIRAQGSAVGDGVTDDTDAILEVLDDAPAGSTILIPPNRTFIVSPTAEGVILPLAKKLNFLGGGNSVLKVADGTGNFTNIIAGDNEDRDLSGCRFMGMTFDLNLANNPVTDESQLQGTVGDYTRRRNPIHAEVGSDIQVLYCTFIDSPRQAAWIANADDPDAIVDPVLAYNRMVTTVEATGDWDITAVFVIGDGAQIIGNRIKGLPSNYYISRTAIQLSGSGVISGNIIDKYYRGPVVGNPNYDRAASDITVVNNLVRDCNYGVVIHSTAGPTHTTGPGIENLTIANNVIRTNKTDFERDSADGSSPCGIFLHGTGAVLPVRNLKIADNQIDNASGYDTDGFPGISLIAEQDDGEYSDVTVENNTIANPARVGIYVDLAGAKVVTVRNNTIRNPGQRSDVAGNQTAGVRIGGIIDVLTVEGNDTIDTRGTPKVEMGVYIDADAVITHGRVIPGRTVATNGTRIPAVDINCDGVEIPRAFTFSPLTVTASTTLVDALTVHLLPWQDYEIQAVLDTDGPAAAGLKLGWTTPASADGFWTVINPRFSIEVDVPSTPTTYTEDRTIAAAAAFTGPISVAQVAVGTQTGVILRGMIRTDADGGDLTLQFAQAVSDPAATRILNGELLATPVESFTA